MRLTTSRLLMRDFEGSDLSAPLPAGLTGMDLPMQAFDFRAPAAVHDQIREAIESAHDEPRREYDLAVVLRDGGMLIGRAGALLSPTEHREARVWFVSDPTSWNQGYLPEASKALYGYCFSELKLHRIWAECDPANEGAVQALERLGMRREAHFIENVWRDGWRDTAVYALLEREWK